MTRLAVFICSVVVVAGGAVAIAVHRSSGATSTVSASVAQPLRTGFAYDGGSGSRANESVALARMRGAGATTYRITLYWNAVAPAQRPRSFDAANPADPAYQWSTFDAQIRRLVANRLQPIVAIYEAPTWARTNDSGVASPPKAADFRAFAEAAAKRYDGHFHHLPRVRFWEVWLEPNLSPNLAPQLEGGVPTAAVAYRGMVDAMADAVHGAAADNVVIAGGLAPFRDLTAEVQAQNKDWGPLAFTRAVLCLSPSLRKACSTRVRADAWAINPYTSGGPQHHAELPNDVSLGDLAKLNRTLAAARRVGTLEAPKGIPLWVTEFSWDSNPPDPCGPPVKLLERWVPEALYRMWAAGVESVTWLSLIDDPLKSSILQSGLYYWASTFAATKPKPYLEGFRFPFVALRDGGAVHVWARTPTSRRAGLVIERQRGARWTRVATIDANGVGIADAVVHVAPAGSFRAVMPTGEASLAFSTTPPPDHFYNPFGQSQYLEPRGAPCTK